MSDNIANLELRSIHAEHLNLRLATEDEIKENDEVSVSISVMFANDSSDYVNKGLIRTRNEISGIFNGISISILLYTEIFVFDNSVEYSKFIENNLSNLSKPGLNKCSVLISQNIETFAQFPLTIDFFEMFDESEKNKTAKDPSES